MKQHARAIILILALLGLVASAVSLYVHYRSLKDPAYTSFCDVSETVSCQALYESEYGSVFGVPVAAGGAIWSALVLLLAWRGMAGTSDARSSGEIAGYVFLLSTLGLAMVLYLGYASFFVIGKVCPLCLTMYVSVIGIFVASGAAASVTLSMLPGRLMRDLKGVVRSPLAATLGVLWLVGSVSLVAFFPREVAQAPVVEGAAVAPPTETLSGAALKQFEDWIAAQPRMSIPLPANGAEVLVLKFNDYQCPSCRQTYLEYKGIVARYEAQFGNRVRFVTMDFPLEAECNLAALHPSACEAAAAVRMARAKNRGREMEEWLFSHQDTMTPQSVKDGLREVAQVTDFDAQYPAILEQVRADAKLGRELGVSGTPAFFVNGIRIQGGLRPVYFEALVAYELAHPRKAQS